MNDILTLEQTVPVMSVQHRLALGLSCLDALAQSPAHGGLRVELESIGPYPLPYTLERHRADRHAARYAGQIKRVMAHALAEGGDTDWVLRIFGGALDGKPAYRPESDARRYVPRRLAIALSMDGPLPAATPLNIRTPWLWPAAAYPLPGTVSAVRGRVLRGASLASGLAVPWARVIATVPAEQADFTLASRVGHAHADAQGEYVLALDARAVSGAALSNPVRVRLWAFAPAAAVPADPLDPLAALPIEACGTASINDVLRGTAVPAAYTASVSTTAQLRLGEVLSGNGAALLFT